MPSIGDILEIVNDAEQFGEDCKNVFHYIILVATGLTDVLDALLAFKDEVLDVVIASTSDSVTFQSLRIENLTDPDEFAILVVDEPGGTGGEALPSFNAVGFLLTPDGAATRPGSKRFAGVREADQSNGVLTGAAIAVWDNIEPVLTATVTGGAAWELHPIILGRAVGGEPELDRYSIVASAALKPDLTSQTSRKKGRGA